MFGKLMESAVRVALTPVAAAVDVAMLPFDAEDVRKETFSRSRRMASKAAESLEDAVSDDE